MSFGIIDRQVAGVRYISDKDHFECYLHQSNLAEKEFAVVEHYAKGVHNFTYDSFDRLEDARAFYEVALARTKERIREALKAL